MCLVCGVLVLGRDAIEWHVAGHKLAEERVRVLWTGANSLIAKPA